MHTYEEMPETRRDGAVQGAVQGDVARFDESEAAWFDHPSTPPSIEKIRAALRSSAPPPPETPPPIGDDQVDGWLSARPRARS
jgi:hypothetical protein